MFYGLIYSNVLGVIMCLFVMLGDVSVPLSKANLTMGEENKTKQRIQH